MGEAATALLLHSKIQMRYLYQLEPGSFERGGVRAPGCAETVLINSVLCQFLHSSDRHAEHIHRVINSLSESALACPLLHRLRTKHTE
jgi:hypothetical protein